MNDDLRRQQEEFRRTLQRQPQLPRHVVAHAPAAPDASLAAILGERPLNAYVHSIIMYLKGTGRPASIQEIKQQLGIDLLAHRDFLGQVCLSDRIDFDPAPRTLRYNPPFGIRTKEDIVPALRRQPNREGIEISELKDTFPRVDDAVAELVRTNDVYVLRVRPDGPRVMFLNEFTQRISVDADLRSLWMSVELPADPNEMRIQMSRAGLTPVPVADGRNALQTGAASSEAATAAIRKPQRRPNRRIKITNDYLGIDLTRDPPTA